MFPGLAAEGRFGFIGGDEAVGIGVELSVECGKDRSGFLYGDAPVAILIQSFAEDAEGFSGQTQRFPRFRRRRGQCRSRR